MKRLLLCLFLIQVIFLLALICGFALPWYVGWSPFTVFALIAAFATFWPSKPVVNKKQEEVAYFKGQPVKNTWYELFDIYENDRWN